ncbi:MAG: hypothetical protein ABSH34_26510 [Verrucomicrobiota bacterium]|jgi:hypothetical protein
MPLAKDSREHRRYWAVSPNVMNDNTTAEQWGEASVRHRAAFMGYWPDDGEHPSGPKFAGMTEKGIQPGHIILIARRHDKKPEIVGFGIVSGKCARRLKNFKPPGDEPFGSLRWMRPFKPWSRPPSGIPLIDALRHNAALAELHPDWNDAHRKVCKWMERQLGKKRQAGEQRGVATNSEDEGDRLRPSAKPVSLVELQENPQLDHVVRTKSDVKEVRKIEDKLLHDYRDWLKKQHRNLLAAKYKRLRCDGYEKRRHNLIEAKSAISREYIRMAVGQLLDYSFQGKQKFGDPNMAVLLPKKPDSDIEQWLQHLNIAIVWQEGESFFDNASGQFS